MMTLMWTTYLKEANNLDNKQCHVGKGLRNGNY